jgi:hypothetical protein
MQREDAIADEINRIPLWPARYTYEDLMDMKADIGTLSFNKRMRNRPVDESMQPFREEYIMGEGDYPGCLDMGRVVEECEPDWRVIQALDPAVGVGKNAKFCGHIVFAIPPEEPSLRLILEVNRLQLTVPQQADLVIDTHMKYPNMILSVVETNSYQKGLQQLIEERMEDRGITLRVEGHVTGTNKLDPEIGVHSLAPLLENGKLRFPMGNPESMRKSRLLIEEFVEYPFFAYTDILMAAWFGVLRSNSAIPNYKSFNRLHPQSMYRPKGARRKVLTNPHYANQTNRMRIVREASEVGAVSDALREHMAVVNGVNESVDFSDD